MKAVLMNGSPKAAGSASGIVLDTVADAMGPGVESLTKRAVTAGSATEEDVAADALVLAFPLYVDCLPAPLLEWLISYRAIAPSRSGRKPARVYAICNCGFHEAAQTELALEVVANFARSAGLEWGGGLGIGSGGMLAGLASVPPGAGIKRSVSEGLDWIAGLAARGEASGETRFVRFAFPRFAYILAAHAGWKAMARANGLRPRDIGNPRRTR
ncbi:MAG: hypothetical protein A2Y38_23050 [Spirochaetes bacterium GWB1_59_5]|nr:MAG: hypothetical protein A2Y38_23050 [Spirochaetes bacterium GWB1_59_5]